METKNLGVKYFVKEGFANVYSGNSLRKIEREIENTYVTNLRYECQREQILRELLRVNIIASRSFILTITHHYALISPLTNS